MKNSVEISFPDRYELLLPAQADSSRIPIRIPIRIPKRIPIRNPIRIPKRIPIRNPIGIPTRIPIEFQKEFQLKKTAEFKNIYLTVPLPKTK